MNAMEAIEPIRQAARQLVRELHLLDGRECIAGYNFSECHLLTELEQLKSATASQMAELLVLEKSTISRLVANLEARKLLSVAQDPEDRRRRLLSLTTSGEEACEQIHNHARAQVSGALDFVADAEIHSIVDGLERYALALRRARRAIEVELRPIRPDDNEAVAAIIRDVMTEFGAVGEGYSINDPEVDCMFETYAAPRNGFWVLERDGMVLGCGGYAPLKGANPDTCELQKMYYRKELRGCGLGLRLLKLCLREAQRDGFHSCYLETLESMSAARALYRRMGFEDLDQPQGCTGHSACNRWMVCTLNDLQSDSDHD